MEETTKNYFHPVSVVYFLATCKTKTIHYARAGGIRTLAIRVVSKVFPKEGWENLQNVFLRCARGGKLLLR